ncbi:tetratricopeptide repeat protein [Candidatus Peregrinibacteria bacterium]|nr:tetratricopeptide repeat protein [Candidatus Peregrinibacteria bacterium]
MTQNTHLMTALKVIVSILVVSAVVFGLIFFNVIQIPSLNLKGSAEQPLPPIIQTKVKRTQAPKNLTYKELLDSGDNYTYKGEFDKALASYQKASEIVPKEVVPYEKIGNVFMSQKAYQYALQNFDFAVNLSPQNAALKIKAVKSLLGLRKVLDAKTRLAQMTPETQTSAYYQGLIAAFLNEQDNAKNFLIKSLTLGNDEAIKTNAQRILTVYRDFELARDGKIEFLQAMLAQAFDQVGEYGLSIELAFNALKTQHDYRDVWIVLGHAFLNEQKWSDAEDALKKAIDLDSNHPAGYFYRGIALRNQKKYTAAIADFEQALKLGWQPRILAKQYIADTYFDLGDFEKAFPLYKEAVLTDTSDIRRFIRPLALAINHLKQPKEALILGLKAIETHPGSAMSFNLLGWAEFSNDDFTNARTHLKKALTIDPELSEAYLNLGQLEENQKNYKQALSYYETAISISQKSGNDSVGATAGLKYDHLKSTPLPTPINLSPNAPALETLLDDAQLDSIPSLSLL